MKKSRRSPDLAIADPTSVHGAAEAYRALGSPIRVEILRVLSERERYCGDLVKLFDLSQSTISHHLKFLREAGLVDAEEHGVSTCYRVNRNRIAALRDHLASLASQ